jgi:hypothetical protein
LGVPVIFGIGAGISHIDRLGEIAADNDIAARVYHYWRRQTAQ